MKQFLFIALLFWPVIINAQKKEIVAYFPEWRAKGEHPYYVKDIEKSGSADKITELNYAFSVPKPDSSENIIPGFISSYMAYKQVYSSEMSIDGIADDSTQPLRGQFNQLKKLKQRHPNLKIVLSIGGWEGSGYFSDAAVTQHSREIFVNACIDRFILGNLPKDSTAGGRGVAASIFDGFDIDWEYPVNGGADSIHHNPEDNNNLSKLLALFRVKLDSIKPGYILTEAVPATQKYGRYYNIYWDQQYLDWYNIMTYDYRGGWDKVTGHNTNLLSSTVDTTLDRERNSFDKSVHLYNCIYGVSRSKIVPGAAFYGRGWGNVDSLNYGLGMNGNSAVGVTEGGYNYFSNLKQLLNQGFSLHWDEYTMAPYLYDPEKKIFWTFDNAKSIALKAHYVKAYDLRGLMFWEISGDDSLGNLVNTIYTQNMPEINIESKYVRGSSPKIEITKPQHNDWINEGSNVIIETNLSGNKYPIVEVEFYGDGKSLGYCTQAPFDWVWFNIPEGNHSIKVIAYDNNGMKKESKPVKIFVRKR
jgi:chitinase